MGFLSAYTGTTRIQIPNPDNKDYWVDLKKYITQGAQEAAEAALAKIVIKDGESTPAPDVARYRKLMVLAAIDDWNLDDENGQILPINSLSVQRLPMPVFNLLWEATSRNNSETERSAEEKVDFRQ